VFCITIPRRRKWEAPNWFFQFGNSSLWKIPWLLFSLLLSGVIVIIDLTIWIFTIFISAGPILVGGITELVLDFEILRHIEESSLGRNCLENSTCLSVNERIELMITVLCGNLDLDVGAPATKINNAIQLPKISTRPILKANQTHLTSMLRSQGTFGSLVGAPVLFFIGSFVLTLNSLSSNLGDNATAHSLAFGMWWMVIVHVTIVSSCTLASNNPSTVTSIVAGAKRHLANRFDRHGGGQEHSNTILGMSPVYDCSFMPVTLWDRGRMKKRWLDEMRNDGLRGRLRLRPLFGCVLIPLFAFILVLIPTAMAFVISYSTPKICIGCR
jgi:hypothetical protein